MNGGWIDISIPIRDGMPHWPGDPDVRVWRFSSIEYGGANVTALSMCAHTGTHVDAPLHYVEGGASVDEMPPEVGLGPARVTVEAPVEYRPGERVLFKGSVLTLDAARQLAQSGVLLVGVDSLSAGPAGAEGDEVHRILLEAGVWILEGLDLAAIDPGDYELLCLPLRIAGADGAPARAFLRPME